MVVVVVVVVVVGWGGVGGGGGGRTSALQMQEEKELCVHMHVPKARQAHNILSQPKVLLRYAFNGVQHQHCHLRSTHGTEGTFHC